MAPRAAWYRLFDPELGNLSAALPWAIEHAMQQPALLLAQLLAHMHARAARTFWRPGVLQQAGPETVAQRSLASVAERYQRQCSAVA